MNKEERKYVVKRIKEKTDIMLDNLAVNRNKIIEGTLASQHLAESLSLRFPESLTFMQWFRKYKPEMPSTEKVLKMTEHLDGTSRYGGNSDPDPFSAVCGPVPGHGQGERLENSVCGSLFRVPIRFCGGRGP